MANSKLYLGDINIGVFKFGNSDISLYLGNEKVYPTESHDYSQDYLTFVALENDSTYSYGGSGISYSIDDGTTWTELSESAYTPSINSGDKIMWKGNNLSKKSFIAPKTFNIRGNIMSLVSGDSFTAATTIKSYQFKSLFTNLGVVSARNLVLPATTLASNCYADMFNGCTSLTSAPKLPATTLGIGCYANMFNGCRSLTTAPELLATTLKSSCYSNMFHGCSSLITAPELPATTLANNCYQDMFYGCTNLTTAPELPATTLGISCYADMFNGCTNLTTAPELPAKTLESNCYANMFYGCTNLTTAPELLATTLVSGCYNYMFFGCSNLNYIKCLANNNSSTSNTQYWVSGVSSTGTFVKKSGASWSRGISSIPEDWNVTNVYS